MGERYCPKIATMQLFHELKQQFPALPDHIVSQCIIQNNHDKESCTQILRATQESRPPPGAFPPPAPQAEPLDITTDHNRPSSVTMNPSESQPSQLSDQTLQWTPRLLKPITIDVGDGDGSGNVKYQQTMNIEQQAAGTILPTLSTAVAARKNKGFLTDVVDPNNAPAQGFYSLPLSIDVSAPSNSSSGFSSLPLSIDVSYKPPDDDDEELLEEYLSEVPVEEFFQPTLMIADEPQQQRSSTSVSLTLRTPSSEPRPPIDICTPGYIAAVSGISSGQEYSSIPSQNPLELPSTSYQSSHQRRGLFQSSLEINLGQGIGAAATGIAKKPPSSPQRPTSLVTVLHNPNVNKLPAGLSVNPANQLPRPTSTISAPTTPSDATKKSINSSHSSSLPTTPLVPVSSTLTMPLGSTATSVEPIKTDFQQMIALSQSESALSVPSTTESSLSHDLTPSASRGAIPRIPRIGRSSSSDTSNSFELPAEDREKLEQVEDEYKPLISEQLIRKNRMAKALAAEEKLLKDLKEEIEILKRPTNEDETAKEKRQLQSEIYQLQLECQRLVDLIDLQSDSKSISVPLGETNEEFYKNLYTGQPYDPQPHARVPPPLPSQPPALTSEPNRIENEEEVIGPSWACEWCTFDNYPLMNICEQCERPRRVESAQGEISNICIRVSAHHHNVSPQRTLQNWAL